MPGRRRLNNLGIIPTPVTPLQAKLQQLNARISAAARAVSRDPAAISLVAVSKTFDAAAVVEAAQAGQRRFAENYAQEGIDKIARVRAALPETPLEWHFIGPIQSNKTRAIAEHFDWVQSVDRARIAARLSEQRPAQLPPLKVLLQVNISGEASKSGAAPGDVAALAATVAALPRLQLRGLMAIPEPTDDPSAQHRAFARVRQIFEQLRVRFGAQFDTLSTGMSADLEAAIAEGATMVRIGTAIFGARQ